MNYIHATESEIIEYPYSILKLRIDNPNVSFPIVMSDEELSAWDVYPVIEQVAPTFDERNENVEQQSPKRIRNTWVLGWEVVNASDEEKARRTETKAIQLRVTRNEQLRNSDYTQLADYTGTDEQKSDWALYRQKLRDLPASAGFPWELTKEDFPPLDLMRRLDIIK